MKKLFLMLLPLLFIGTIVSAAEDFYIKPYVGVIVSTSIDNKIDVGNGLSFEDYEGNPGVEARIAVGASRLEVKYILQTYSADKDGKTPDGLQTEKGTLDFTNETLDVAGYLFEKGGIKSGFNISVGMGRGTTTLTIDSYSLDGIAHPSEGGEQYMKEFHYHADVHYTITEMFEVSGSYMSQTITPIDGTNFNNSLISILASIKF